MGSLMAAQLWREGLEVQLLYRQGRQLPEGPLILQADGEKQCLDIGRASVGACGDIHRLLLCTKANQAIEALESVRPRLAERAIVILLHNGMGTLEPAQALLGEHRVLAGVTTQGAFWNAQGELVHAGHGSTHIGQPGTVLAPGWFEAFSRALPGAQWDPEIIHSLWRKLLINCAINPLTALHNCRNGELTLNHRERLDALCVELASVAEALGYSQLARDLHDDVFRVCSATASNHSSMLSDIRAARPSEIEAITGYLCRRCEALGVNCPLNLELLQAIRKLENCQA